MTTNPATTPSVPTRYRRVCLSHRDVVAKLLNRVGLQPELVRYVMVVFTTSRLCYVALTLFTLRFLHSVGSSSTSFLSAWARYDATFYARLAQDGYQPRLLYRTAFFPLQPLLTRLVLPLAGGNGYVAGLIVSNVSFLIALLGLAVLASRTFDSATAHRAILYLTLFPTAFFLFAGYAESLFLALAIWCIVAARRGWWWQAGVLGLLASLTRQAGIFLVFPFAYEYAAHVKWHLKEIRLDAMWGLLIPTGLLLFAGWLWLVVDDPLAFLHAEKSWQHILVPPWVTLWQALLALPNQPDRIFLFKSVVDLAGVMLFAALIIFGVNRMPLGDVLYSAAFWLLALSYPTQGWPLQSDARYMLTIFPCFILLGVAGRRPWLHAVLLTAFSLCLLAMTQYYLRGAVII